MRGIFFALVLALACALFVTQASAVSPVPDAPIPGKTGFLDECSALKENQQVRCYVRRLLAIIERSGNPARELPRIDRKVHESGGFLEAACHGLMHEVGRTWGRRHGVTLETLYHYVPRSNDPGCSAGFGMGLIMHLGTKLVLEPRAVLPTCTALPTRFREYTCVHGSGHAFMRGYHGQLASAIIACKSLGARFTPDCAQGAFHDYWISLSGADSTTRPKNADTSARSVCASFTYVRPCWYRFFWERRSAVRLYYPADILRLCRGLVALQRAGCVGGASLQMSRAREPADQARTCGLLDGADALNCIRGVVVPALANRRFEQFRLIRTCRGFPKEARWGCYSWFGRTLAVVTDGRFLHDGCPRLDPPHARISCVAGAKRMRHALATFS